MGKVCGVVLEVDFQKPLNVTVLQGNCVPGVWMHWAVRTVMESSARPTCSESTCDALTVGMLNNMSTFYTK